MALRLLEGASLTSEKFKEIVYGVEKTGWSLRGRSCFNDPAGAGGVWGGGGIRRVILLLDEAAALSLLFQKPVARESEFCSAAELTSAIRVGMS